MRYQGRTPSVAVVTPASVGVPPCVLRVVPLGRSTGVQDARGSARAGGGSAPAWLWGRRLVSQRPDRRNGLDGALREA